MEQTNKYNLPDPVVTALTRDDYTRGESHISVTQLIDSPRVRLLRDEYDHAIEEDVSENLWSVLGRAAHTVMEDTADGERYIAERRFSMEVLGWTLSGAVDLCEWLPNGALKLWDYKVTSVWSVIFGKIEWEYQLNCYAQLVCEELKAPVEEIEIIVIARDWVNSKARMDPNYPQCPIIRVPIKLWSAADRSEFIERRMAFHQEAEFQHATGGDLPPCSPEERWQKETKYAVKKRGNKRAAKVYDIKEDAEAHVDSADIPMEIEVREGSCVRCEQNWCRVAEWCDQYQNELIARENE